MRRFFNWSLTVATATATLIAVAAPAQAAPGAAAPPVSAGSASAGNLTGTQLREQTDRLNELLPPAQKAKIAAFRESLELADDDLKSVVDQVIEPGDYVCESTPLFDWVDASIADWTEDELFAASLVLLIDPVTFDALLFPEDAKKRFFGADGEYTNPVRRTFRGLRGFWDIPSADIEVVPAHGSTLLDRARVARVLKVVGELSDEDAAEAADAIAVIVDQDVYDHGDHPIFTFNAFAFSAEGEEIPGVGQVSDKIVMGDGVLTGYRAIGLGDVAPAAILSHEFAHHVQYEKGLFESDLPAPEATRRTELMADGFGSYYLAHHRGANLRWNRIKQYMTAFYNIGDCGFDSPGHHGTPKQRLRAAGWGTWVGLSARPVTRVLPSLKLAKRFERALPALVAPDAPSADAFAEGRVAGAAG